MMVKSWLLLVPPDCAAAQPVPVQVVRVLPVWTILPLSLVLKRWVSCAMAMAGISMPSISSQARLRRSQTPLASGCADFRKGIDDMTGPG
jgi:hypothetical protein